MARNIEAINKQNKQAAIQTINKKKEKQKSLGVTAYTIVIIS